MYATHNVEITPVRIGGLDIIERSKETAQHWIDEALLR